VQPHWAPDPTRRHALRWWDGQQWTDNVLDGQNRSTDPLVPAAGGAASAASFIGSVGRSSDAGTPVNSRRAALAWFGGLSVGALVLVGVVAFGGNKSDDKVVTIAVTSATSVPVTVDPGPSTPASSPTDAVTTTGTGTGASTGTRTRSTRRTTRPVQAAASTTSPRPRSTTTRPTSTSTSTTSSATTSTTSTGTTESSSSTTSPVAGTTVRSGEPCTQPGAFGVTNKGVPMICAATVTDPALKWRRVG